MFWLICPEGEKLKVSLFFPFKVSTMPSFNFGLVSQSNSPAPIGGKISLSSTFSTSSSKQFIFSPPEKVNSGNVAASATSQQKFVFSLPDKVKSANSSLTTLTRHGSTQQLGEEQQEKTTQLLLVPLLGTHQSTPTNVLSRLGAQYLKPTVG